MSEDAMYAGKGMTPQQAADFGDWLNEWADVRAHDRFTDRAFRDGWYAAVSQIFDRFRATTDWHFRGPPSDAAAPATPETP